MKKFLIGFFVGSAITGAITYYLTKKYVEDNCQKDINDIKAYYKEKNKDKEISCDAGDTGDAGDKKEETEPVKKHVNKVPDKPIPPEYKAMTDMYRSADSYDREDIGDAPDEYYDPAEAESPKEDRPDIELISYDEYEGINHAFEHTCLIYYVNDGQLAYENGELVDDERYLVGDSIDVDGWRNNDDAVDNIYVRNNRISEMFEIAKCIGCYGDLN